MKWDNGRVSSQGPLGGRQRQVMYPSVPRGEVVATFETYPEAQLAVDVLARADFPVDQVSIVGSDLKTVERVTGKLTWGRVALAGAVSGVWLGIFFGLLIVIFSPTTSFGFLIAAVIIGAGFGMLFGLVSYAITRRRRDYTSMTQVLATSYSIVVDPGIANRARNLLGEHGTQGVQQGAQAGSAGQNGHPSDLPPAPPAAPPADREPRPYAAGTPAPRYGEYAPPREQGHGQDAGGQDDSGGEPPQH